MVLLFSDCGNMATPFHVVWECIAIVRPALEFSESLLNSMISEFLIY
ncbi:hypothetical protein TRICHSKD4_2632 [Roseibium sp. TrichSKD4]|nr:hypothetical protein TRICHSKD4_2632 [Roseibium sp. TrichSKD4]